MRAAAADDAALLAELREFWQAVDPAPDGLADQLITTIAMADFAQQWELLSLVSDAEYSEVRQAAEPRTLQFGDGATAVLLHLTETADGRRRVDGWVDGRAAVVELRQGSRTWRTEPNPTGRFEFDLVPPGRCELRLLTEQPDGGRREFRTPEFEL